MSTPVDTERDTYAERVQAALADLPAADRAGPHRHAPNPATPLTPTVHG